MTAFPALGADSEEIWGHVINSDKWEQYDEKYGIYTFDPTSLESVPLIDTWDNWFSTLEANGGCIYYDGLFHFINYTPRWYGPDGSYNEISSDTWDVYGTEDRQIPADWTIIAMASAYDASTGKVFAYTTNEDATANQLTVIDYSTLTSTTIAPTDNVYVAMACDKSGILYAISDKGILYKIDKDTGNATKVGNTGVKPMTVTQCATINPSNSMIYWAAMQSDGDNYKSTLYSVDPMTAKTTKIKDFPNNEELACIVVRPAPDSRRPQTATDLTFDFPGGRNIGSISFRVATSDCNGNPLSSPIKYVVKTGSGILAYGHANPGEKVILDNVELPYGKAKIVVVTENEWGESSPEVLDSWVGFDPIPAAVQNVRYELTDNNTVKLSWDAVTKGIHGAPIDTDAVRYYVTKYPGNRMIADGITNTSFTDALSPDTLKVYEYTVVSCAGDYYSAPGSVKFKHGPAFRTPYIETFDCDGIRDDYDGFDTFTVVDANKDGSTFTSVDGWGLGMVRYEPNKDNNADDWLITPPIILEPGRVYGLRMRVKSDRPEYLDEMEVKLGTDTLPQHFFKDLMPRKTLSGSYIPMEHHHFTVDKEQEYTIGLHEVTQAGLLYASVVDKISVIEEALFGAPGAVADLKGIAGSKGEKTVEISFNAPSLTADGELLKAIDRIEIKKDDNVIADISDVMPGQMIKYKDKDAQEGDNVYTVLAYNDKGRGLESDCYVVAGNDIPLEPQNAVIDDKLDGTAIISWDPSPEIGQNGGYVDPESLVYDVIRRDVYYDDYYTLVIDDVVLASNISDRAATVELPEAEEGQMRIFQNFFVQAVNTKKPEMASPKATVDYILIGKEYNIPFIEGFASSEDDGYKWVSKDATYYSWYRASGLSSDGDGHCAAFSPFNPGDEAHYSTWKINIDDASDPKLIFRYYAIPGADMKLDVHVACHNARQGEEDVVWSVDYTTDQNPEGWIPVAIDLKPYIGHGYLQVDFHAASSDLMYPVAIDDVAVRDVKQIDLRGKLCVLPQYVIAGDELQMTAVFENYGTQPVQSYKVNLYVNDKLFDSVDFDYNLEPNIFDNISFKIPTSVTDTKLDIHAEIVCDGDMDEANNATPHYVVELIRPQYVTIDDLSAEATDKGVVLNWSAPSNDGSLTITDSFENYPVYSTGDMGHWTLLDRDETPTYGFDLSVGSFPGMGQPFAYMVFSTEEFGLDREQFPGYYAHTGDNFLACFGSQIPGQSNDDWLISPLLSGLPHKISFFSKAWTSEEGDEEIEVLYSLSDMKPESFVKIGETIKVSDLEWGKYEIDIPQGANYFAIRCVSTNKFILMLDDITYQPGIYPIRNYKVYRNKEFIAMTQDSYYEDVTPFEGTNEYNVSVVYDRGESDLSNTASVMASAVSSIKKNDIKVYPADNTIIIENAKGHTVNIYSIDGFLMARIECSDISVINISKGLYIVRMDDDECAKSVLVK